MDFNKYNYVEQKVEAKPKITPQSGADQSGSALQVPPKVEETIQSWKDSAPIIRLSEYLKKHKDQGISLYQRNGEFALRPDPDMTKEELNGHRGQILRNVFTLLIDAKDDLNYLIDKNLIDIPTKHKERVLPEASCDTGNSNLDGSQHLK